eukprot:333153_1
MALQSSADRQRNRFHGYREPQSVIILFEGVFILILYTLWLGFILRNEKNEGHKGYSIKYVRQGIVLIFNIVQIFMLFPLRTIAVEPSITRDYFLNSSKTKYITTFKWMILLNVITFIYSFIFISNKYGNMISGGFSFDSDNNGVYLLSYTFTFCMPYYALWVISQFDKWAYLEQNNVSYPESKYSLNNSQLSSNDLNILEVDDSFSVSTAQKVQIKQQDDSTNLKENLTIKRSNPKIIKRERMKSEGAINNSSVATVPNILSDNENI